MMAARITAPNKSYTGISAGVAFSRGEGYTDDPRLIEWFRAHGYTVEEPDEMPFDEDEGPHPENARTRAVRGKKRAKKKEA